MKSWLRDGAEITFRAVHEGVVTYVWGGDYGRRLFEAQVGAATCHYDSGLIVERDRPLLAKDARFWLVVERAQDGGGFSAIAIARPGVDCARAAFGVGEGPTDLSTNDRSL